MDELVAHGYSARGIFLMGIGQGGMAACHCALNAVHRVTTHSDGKAHPREASVPTSATAQQPASDTEQAKQQRQQEQGQPGQGVVVGVRKVLGGVLCVNAPLVHPLARSTVHAVSERWRTHSAAQQLLPPVLTTHASQDPFLALERVCGDARLLERCGVEVGLTQAPEPAILSPTTMRAIFSFLGQHMRTVLQHLADEGHLTEVAQ